MGEYETMDWLFAQGVDRYHVRRPEATFEQVKNCLNRVRKEYRSKTSIHSRHELKSTYAPCGIHHTSNSEFDSNFQGTQSKSFHSIEEIKNNKHAYDFGFLSPVFPSISKVGYKADFDEKELQKLNEETPFPLYALGGISHETAKKAKELGFAGVVLFGTIWEEIRITKIEDNFNRLCEIVRG